MVTTILELKLDELESVIEQPPSVEYKNGYTADSLPDNIFRVKDYRGAYWTSVTGCHLRESADRELGQELKHYSDGVIRYHPEMKVVRIGWGKVRHFYEIRRRGWPNEGRSCHANATAWLYVDMVPS